MFTSVHAESPLLPNACLLRNASIISALHIVILEKDDCDDCA